MSCEALCQAQKTGTKKQRMRELVTATTAHSSFVKENQISQHRPLVGQKGPKQDRESAGFSVDMEHHTYEICIK